MTADIELAHVTVSFPWEQGVVLSDISCRFSAGRITAVIGESGSGKSVLGKAIVRLLDRAEISGSIRFDGRELTRLSERALREIRGRRIFFLPQEPAMALNPSLTIGEQLTEALEYHHGLSAKEAARRAEAELSAYGFTEEKKIIASYAFELSGGMQQRVLGAMASALRPEWIIADEPTKGLDPVRNRQMTELLRTLSRKGERGLILITHDLRFVARLAQDAIVLRQGALVEAGEAQDILSRPKTEYTRQLVKSARFAAGGEAEAL